LGLSENVNAKIVDLVNTPGVQDSLNKVIRTKTIRYASNGTPTVAWESLTEERLNRIALGRYHVNRTVLFENDLFPIDHLIADDTLSPEMIADIIMFGDMI
jgi:hypothetical protein